MTMTELGDFIHGIEKAENFEAALTILGKAVKKYGFQNYFFSHIDTDEAPAKFNVKYYATNFEEAWQQRYIEKNYFFIDPVHRMVLANSGPFYWSQQMQHMTDQPGPEVMEMMQDAMAHGLIDGMGFSYLENGGNLCTLTIAKSTPITDYDSTLLAEFSLIGSRLANYYSTHLREEDAPIQLSEREIEVLTYAAIGKTDSEIAALLNLSINTVRYYWKALFDKLQSHGRTFAVIKAIQRGYINPSIYELTTESGSSNHYRKAS